MDALRPIHVSAAEIETPLFAGNFGFWDRLVRSVTHRDHDGRSCQQQLSEIRFGPGMMDGRAVGVPQAEADQTQMSQLMALDIVDRMISRLEWCGHPLAGRPIGVFVAQSESGMRTRSGDVNAYYALGVSRAVVANRISQRYGWSGPSLSFDTACSSGLFAVHMARRAILAGDCEAAVAIGVNLFESNDIGDSLRASQLLSPSGVLGALGANRNGYVRSEGVCSILLVGEALHTQLELPSYLTIDATAVNQNSGGRHFAIPDEGSQRRLYTAALNEAGLAGSDLQYIEMHATGTVAGDLAELASVSDIFADRRGRGPLLVGALKSNIGHLEGASGLAAVCKLVLAFARGLLPATPTGEGLVDLKTRGTIKFLVRDRPIAPGEQVRIGVSSFGFGGANAFAILQGVGQERKTDGGSAPSRFSYPRLPGGGHRNLDAEVSDITTRAEARGNLLLLGSTLSHARGAGFSYWRDNNVLCESRLQLSPVFCFGGQAAPNNEHHRSLYQSESCYAKTIDDLAGNFGQRLDLDLVGRYYGERQGTPHFFDQIFCFAHQVAVAQSLIARGLQPRGLIGYSMGEIAAYVVAGGLSMDDAAHVMTARTEAMIRGAQGRELGTMLEVTGEREQIAALLQRLDGLDIAGRIAPGKIVLAGTRTALDAVLDAQPEIHTRFLRVADAFHSRMMVAAANRFAHALAEFGDMRLTPFRAPLYSTIDGREMKRASCDALVRQLSNTVCFEEALAAASTAQPMRALVDLSASGQIVSFSQHLSTPVVSAMSLIDGRPDKDTFAIFCARHGLALAPLPPPEPIPHAEAMFAPILPLRHDLDAPRPISRPTGPILEPEPAEAPIELLPVFQRAIAGVVEDYEPDRDNNRKWFELIHDSFLLTMIVHEVNLAFGVRYEISEVITQFQTPEALLADIERRCDGKPLPAVAPAAREHDPGNSTEFQHPQQLQAANEAPMAFLEATVASRRHNENARTVLANPRSLAARFHRYPVVATDARGAEIHDLDGRRMVDLAMGFGTLFFGHKSPLLFEAIMANWREGGSIGPENDRSARLAELVCTQTGHDRACFTTTGTEAVMIAIRLARSYTRRTKIVIFADSYHGHSDAVLGFASQDGSRMFPSYPGVTQGVIDDLIVLKYRDAASVKQIKPMMPEVAAVLVEPVQSSNLLVPEPGYIALLRALCDEAGAVLVFDEILTGFRAGLRGAAEVFGTTPDIALFGKMIGCGLPIGCVCGRSAVLDHVDGGGVQYRSPEESIGPTTFLAGTYNKNALSVQVAAEVLKRLQSEPELIIIVARKVERIWERFLRLAPPELARLVTLRVYGSVFRFVTGRNAHRLPQYMIANGVYIFEAGSCFVSEVHSDAMLDRVAAALLESLEAMVAAGDLTPGPDDLHEGGKIIGLPAAKFTTIGRHCPMTDVQFGVLKECLLTHRANEANVIGFATAPMTVEDAQLLLDRFDALRAVDQVFRLRLPEREPDCSDWKYKRSLLTLRCFVETDEAPRSAYLQDGTTNRDADFFYDIEAERGLTDSDILYGRTLYRVECTRACDGRVVLVFGFHHIAFDGFSISSVAADLLNRTPVNVLPARQSFAELNRAAMSAPALCSPDEQEIERHLVRQTLETPPNGDFLHYETIQVSVSADHVFAIQEWCAANTNIAAFAILSMALRRYFDTEALTIACTESGRNLHGSTLKGLGMLARYFPCFVSLTGDNEDGPELASAYWRGYGNSFNDFLQYVMPRRRTEHRYTYLFAYNFDDFDVDGLAGRAAPAKTFYAPLGLYDIMAYACATSPESECSGQEQLDHVGLAFRIEYSPTTIDYRRLRNAFYSAVEDCGGARAGAVGLRRGRGLSNG